MLRAEQHTRISVFYPDSSFEAGYLLWNDERGIRQAAIGEATGDLCNLPGPMLHAECQLKQALIVVSIPIGPDSLEEQIPGRRGIAHLGDAAVDKRDANQERWRNCPLLLQGLRVLPPGRIHIMLVDGSTERAEDLRGSGDEPGNGVGDGKSPP